jgi:hypothetical protein
MGLAEWLKSAGLASVRPVVQTPVPPRLKENSIYLSICLSIHLSMSIYLYPFKDTPPNYLKTSIQALPISYRFHYCPIGTKTSTPKPLGEDEDPN